MIILCNAVQRLYQGVLCVQNPIYVRYNSQAYPEPMFTEHETGHWHRVQMYHTEFRPDRLTNVKVGIAVHFYPAVKYGCHWAEFHETRKCKQNFTQVPCTGCVYLIGDNMCEQQIRLAFHLRPSVT